MYLGCVMCVFSKQALLSTVWTAGTVCVIIYITRISRADTHTHTLYTLSLTNGKRHQQPAGPVLAFFVISLCCIVSLVREKGERGVCVCGRWGDGDENPPVGAIDDS